MKTYKLKCAIIANGYYHGNAYMGQITCIYKELEKRGVTVDVIHTDKLIVYLSSGRILSGIGAYDFILFLDKDVYISHMLENAGYNLVNTATSIELCDDKLKTYIALADKGINIPETIASPLNYVGIKDDFYQEVQGLLGYPVVVKEVYGSMGRTVYLAKDQDQLIRLRNDLVSKPHLYQRFVGTGGKDIRVIVIGGKVVGAMLRENLNDFRSNIELGGVGTKYEPSNEVIEIATKVATVLGLDYCGVDIICEEQKYYVCEVNSNAFFDGFNKATGINVGALYADYLVKKFS